MSKKLLTIEVPEELYDEFWGSAGSKDGPWRSNKQTAQDSLGGIIISKKTTT